MNNLDYIAAKTGQNILSSLQIDKKENEKSVKKELEKLINDALLVLHNNGVYACILYLYASEKKKDVAKKIAEKLLYSVKEALGIVFENLDEQINEPERVLNIVNEKICNNVDTLFLVKNLWERILIYARYGAKAKVKN
jgi:hypothetical protein